MIKNEYTEKMNEIKAPQSAVENAVKAALEADKNRKEVITVPKKSNIIRLISAAAACAVVVTGVAVISNMNSNKRCGSCKYRKYKTRRSRKFRTVANRNK